MSPFTRKLPPPDGALEDPGLVARLRHRLAKDWAVAPFNATSDTARVSFTFDDVPVSAATHGAALLEEAGGRATFYVAGGLLGQADKHWQVIDADAVVRLHAQGHEIGCHSHSHIRADQMSGAQIAADIVRNRALLKAVEPSLPLENFAYPFGHANLAWKRRLKAHFRSSRSIWPQVNQGATDAHYLKAVPLMDREVDPGHIDRAFEAAAKSRGWLIFYSHDVGATPSDYGCSPRILRHALTAAARFGVKIETVSAALTGIGAGIGARIGTRLGTVWLITQPLLEQWA